MDAMWRTSHLTSEQFGGAWPGATEYLKAMKDSFPHAVPDPQIPGSIEYRRRLSESITAALSKTMTAQEALDSTVGAWDKITKRRRKKRQLKFWQEQMEAMTEAGIVFRPELADK